MGKQHSSHCQLCGLTVNRQIITPLHHEDELIMVVDCLVCHTPMAVLKKHRAAFSQSERQHILDYFRTIAAPGSVIDWEQRKIPDHAHCHLRPKPFPGTDGWEYLFDHPVP